jgi:BirA family biotin operon repressor/biotin-[acetyl-CoA-carboxylase] ligase
VVAEEQTGGRGRLGRTWDAPSGLGLLCTVVLRDALVPPVPGQIPMAAGLAVIDAVSEVTPALASRLALKWPNDLLIAGVPHPGKTAGLLVESVYQAGNMTEVLLGMGINVLQSGRQLPRLPAALTPATSLSLAAGVAADRTDLLIALCAALARRLAEARARREALFADWRARLVTLGQAVTVSQPQQGVIATGRAVDVQPDGSLLVEQADGRHITIASGDVTLRTDAVT